MTYELLDPSREGLPQDIRIPHRVIPAEVSQSEVPEFNYPMTMQVKYVGQGRIGFTSDEVPLLTTGLTQCHLVILKTISRYDPSHVKYGFVHVNSGFLDENHAGHQLPDIAAQLLDDTTAIVVSGSKSIHMQSVMRQLEAVGITTVKHIKVNTEVADWTTWLHVAYRPDTDEVLTKAGSDVEFTLPIFVFHGFSDAEVSLELQKKAYEKRQAYARNMAGKHLERIRDEIIGFIYIEDLYQARVLLQQACMYAQKYGINLDTEYQYWRKLREKLGIE